MYLDTLLMQPLKATDQVISLSGGPLEVGTVLILDPRAHTPERCVVHRVLSPTQGMVVRGADGTTALGYPLRTLVQIAVDAVDERPVEELDTDHELTMPGLVARTQRKLAVDVSTTFKQGACPHCGCTGDHPK